MNKAVQEETINTERLAPEVCPAPRVADEVIRLENIHRVYAAGELEVRALRGASLTVRRGEFVAIMGPSGSGKSTMMNIIGCLDKPTKGNYFLEGIDVSTLSRDALADIRNRKIGFVFQSLNLVPRTDAIENVELPMLYAGVPAQERARRARESLAAVGLSEKENSLPSQLSGGQQQRVAIARALAVDPPVLLMDEPTASLDHGRRDDLARTLSQLAERGRTVLVATHDVDFVRACAHRVVVLESGTVTRAGTPADVLRDAP